MREKDNLYDRLQTFVDERLLEVAGQISVKQEKEEKKTDNIEYLANLRADIGMQKIISLIKLYIIDNLNRDNYDMQQLKAEEEDKNRKYTQQTNFLLQQIRETRDKQAKLRKSWKVESAHLYKNLKI